MNEDEERTQNSEESESEESAGKKLDDVLGAGEEKSDEDAGAGDDESTLKEEKKQRDFERAFYKANEKAKRLEAELKAKNEVETDTGGEATKRLQKDEEAYLKDLFREVIHEDRETSLAIEDMKSKPYFDVLEGKILEIASKLPSNLSHKEKLETAYQKAAADNLDLIVETAVKFGQEDGFKNRNFKKNQGSIKATPANKTANLSDQQDRYRKGELTDEEFTELRNDGTLEQWDREELGI
jgi:hypothetical protein